MPEGESFSESFEVGRLIEGDGDLGIYFPSALVLDVLFTDRLNVGQSVLREDLPEFADKRDALSHALDLDLAVLQEDQLRKEDALVQSGGPSDSINLGFVELGALSSRHQH